MKRSVFFISAIFLFSFSIFAEINVVNPVPGNFANPQTLVIESNAGEEIFYSFTGSDPLTSGFAYDGPVLLDVTGNVELRVASVDKNLKHSETTIAYTVTPATIENAEHNAFIASMQEFPVFEYTAGNKISIPFTMTYSFGSVFERGKEISISKDATVERYVPLSVRDANNNEWRFVVSITPLSAGQFSRREVPFKISDWTRLIFTDPRMIYSLDGSWWYNSSDVVNIDRSVENIVYYQSAEYSPENPIKKVVLPPKPSLQLERQFDGALKIRIKENSYAPNGDALYMLTASQATANKIFPNGMYSEFYLDVFTSDKIEGMIPLDVFSSGVYQGTLLASVDINRVPPNIPIVKSSADGFYSREDVQVIATAPQNLKLYVGVSDPIEIAPSFETLDLSKLNFNVPTFSLYDGSRLTLYSDMEKILAYKVLFYSEDVMGIKSETVSYSVIVDKYNYYVDASSTAQTEEGTPFAPFKDLSHLAKIVNSNKFSRFYIKGEVQLSAGEVSLNSNVEFCGLDDAQIEIPETSVLILKNAGLFVENIMFEKTIKTTQSKKLRAVAKALTNLFIIENSAATFNNCQIVGKFAGDGAVINISAGVLNLNKTGVSNTAQGYASALTAISSKIKINESSLACTADTSVGISVNGGSFVLENSLVQSTGRMARIAEFIGGTVSLDSNEFRIKSSLANTEAMYKTNKTQFIKDQGNVFK